MMRFITIILLFSSLFAINADELFENPINDETRLNVEAIFSSIATYKLVKSDFTQAKTITRLKRSINSSGIMIFDSSKGIAWQILKPFPSTTVLTDNAMIQKSPGGQVRIMNSEGNETFHRFSTTIQSIFLGHFSLILEEYEIYYQPGDQFSWRIGLIPKDSGLKQIVKAFEIEGDDFINIFRIHEGSDDQILYEFDNITFPDTFTQEDENVFN